MISKVTLSKEEILLKELGYINVICIGDSMLPTLSSGKVIRVNRCDSFNVGDVVAFVDTQIVVHRLVASYLYGSQLYFLEKGDHFLCLPKLISNDIILGKVSALQPRDFRKIQLNFYQILLRNMVVSDKVLLRKLLIIRKFYDSIVRIIRLIF